MFYEVLANEPVSPEKRAAVEEVLTQVDAGETLILTSVATSLEVIPDKLDAKGVEDAEQFSSLFDGKKYAEVEITANVIIRAREIRNFYFKPSDSEGKNGKMMDLGDAIHLATATIFGAEEFHTRDDNNKGVKVSLVSLYKNHNQTKICDKYEMNIASPESDQGRFQYD